MKKMPTLFKRDEINRSLVTREVNPEAQWVVAGEGIATRKWDGTCCLVKDGFLFKRYDAKHGKTPPEGFIPAQPEADPNTGHWPGWLAVRETREDCWFLDVVMRDGMPERDGTYELVGPKINGNREKLEIHSFIKHGDHPYPDAPRAYDELRDWFLDKDIEGLVWHHPDGRMVKIKKKDFGI